MMQYFSLLHTWGEKYKEMIGAAWEFRRMLYGTGALISCFQHGGHYAYVNFAFYVSVVFDKTAID